MLRDSAYLGIGRVKAKDTQEVIYYQLWRDKDINEASWQNQGIGSKLVFANLNTPLWQHFLFGGYYYYYFVYLHIPDLSA